jgi:hypothetical protein
MAAEAAVEWRILLVPPLVPPRNHLPPLKSPLFTNQMMKAMILRPLHGYGINLN